MESATHFRLFGLVILAVLLLFGPFAAYIEWALAIVIVVAAIVGSFLIPRREMFYVRTAIAKFGRAGTPIVEQDYVAIRVEIVRMWLLFIPTSAAVAFLVFVAAGGLEQFATLSGMLATKYTYVVFQAFNFVPVGVVFLLSAWINERRVLRDAHACAARSFAISGREVSYQFMGEHGEYLGGYSYYVGLVQPNDLANIVFYNVTKPDLNKIAMGFLFHRLVVVGRGIADLDEETIATLTPAIKAAS